MQDMHTSTLHRITAAAVTACLCSAAPAGNTIPDYDFQWATIGDPGNDSWMGIRGGVDYEYRISRLEMTNAQYLEFLQIFAPMMDEPNWGLPIGPGIVPGFGDNHYSLNPNIPQAGQLPVIMMTWRHAAMFVNWLHNDKTPELWAIMDGAYDVSTFGEAPGGGFTDQLAHSPDAKFWIPTLDEWTKAVYYDPNRFGLGQGGWWDFPNGTDTELLSGDPGVGDTNAGFGPFDDNPFFIPVGSYPLTQTPWGLLDASGGAAEWTETSNFPTNSGRAIKGPGANDPLSWDFIGFSMNTPPTGRSAGLRIASVIAIPAPQALPVLGLWYLFSNRRRRKKCITHEFNL